MISVYSLFSGSKGNSTLVISEDTRILIDAGNNAKKIKEALHALDITPGNIDAIFLTHEHSDHISALPVFIKSTDAAVHITEPSLANSRIEENTPLFEALVVHESGGYTAEIGNLAVTAVPVPHDSAACMAYVIRDDSGDSFAICTDMGYVTKKLAAEVVGVRQAIIEANHNEKMLIEGPYPEPLKRRILGRNGHLSNDTAALFASFLAENGTGKIMLGHISEVNNTPECAYETVHNKLIKEGLSPKLTVASQYEIKSL